MAKSARARSTCAAGALSERLRRVKAIRSSGVSGRRGSLRWRDIGHLGARGSSHHYTRARGKYPLVHGIREAQRRGQAKALLWPWSRMTAYRRVQEVIAAAGIPAGPHACPKGLRHGFGVQAVSRGIALNMVQKWLGHAQLTTTAIYANAVGEEEQSIAARMW